MSSSELSAQPTIFVSINGRLCPAAVWGPDVLSSEAGTDLFQIKEQSMSSTHTDGFVKPRWLPRLPVAAVTSPVAVILLPTDKLLPGLYRPSQGSKLPVTPLLLGPLMLWGLEAQSFLILGVQLPRPRQSA